MLFLHHDSKHDLKSSGLDKVAGRLACWWFLLTAIGQLWMWPLVLRIVYYARNQLLTVAFFGYLVYILIGPGAKACRTCAWPKPFRRWSLWRLMASYFDARLVKTVNLDPSGNYLFAIHPHGVIAISSWINFVTDATGFSETFPGIELHAATLESNFRVPLLREYVLLHGMVDASRDTLKEVLSGPPGRSAMLVVGGAAESLLAAPGTYDLVLHSRRGFVKIALRTGASLVPVIAYGETDTFHTYIPPPSSKAAAVMRRIKRTFGFATPLCWGTGVLGGWGMMPLQTPLVSVVGAPLPVKKASSPTEEQVEQLHAAYIAALTKLWEDTNSKYGKGVRRGLAIVQ